MYLWRPQPGRNGARNSSAKDKAGQTSGAMEAYLSNRRYLALSLMNGRASTENNINAGNLYDQDEEPEPARPMAAHHSPG